MTMGEQNVSFSNLTQPTHDGDWTVVQGQEREELTYPAVDPGQTIGESRTFLNEMVPTTFLSRWLLG